MTQNDAPGWETAQTRLVQQLRRQHTAGEAVLRVLARVPREIFVEEDQRARAFEDEALPIAHAQTISQPTVVAAMTDALDLAPTHRVLEVGTGSGYQAAVLAELAAEVVTVERISPLAEQARQTLEFLGYRNVQVHISDGTLGWPAGAPYDRILVAAAAPTVPVALTEQLAPEGRLVLPIGGRDEQHLIVVTRGSDGSITERSLGPVRFVPLIGAQGWPDLSSAPA